jgi:ribosomal-protein-alanine N-acetyltransferase
MKLFTERLSIGDLTSDHAPFMFELMNSPKWKEFIGDRNIQTVSDAANYIKKIIDRPQTDYWVILQKEGNLPIGVVTFMKRDHLKYFDIGFAILPEFYGKGFAFEATAAVIKELKKDEVHERITAITIPSNDNSKRLLERLGFTFEKEIEQDEETLCLYSNELE